MLDVNKLADAVVNGAKAYVEKALVGVLRRLDEIEAREIPPGERGEKGDAGDRGTDGAPGPAGAPGAPGESGRDGMDGKDGHNGKDGVDGAPGRDGRDGLPGVPGPPGSPGEKGYDGKDGRDGIDGTDGLGFDDLDVAHDGERTITVRFTRGDVIKEFPIVIPTMIYRGVYKADQTYTRGDTVTWGGSLWHCNDNTADKPEGSKAWTLATKRGRDGKDGKDGSPGERGLPGERGRDLTQLGTDGSKW